MEDPSTRKKPGPGSPRVSPGWLKVLGVVVLVAFIVFIVIAHLTGLIGPGMHGR